MAKSIRSKIKKRLRTVKRQRVDAMIVRPQVQANYDNLVAVMQGRSVRLNSPKNAFKYPEDEAAVFSQHEIFKPIDFRSSHLPMAGYVYRGNRKMSKYTGEQADYMEKLKKTNHPKEEVMAGGGCILAKTGEVITKHHAEILATAQIRPEVAAVAMAGVASASSAVAAAVAEDTSTSLMSEGVMEADAADDGSDQQDEIDEEAPGNTKSDHLRRPVVKGNKSAAQKNRPRSNAALKTKKVAPAASPGKKAGQKAGSPAKKK